MFIGETVTVGSLTFTASSFVNATTVANNFSARMSNSSSAPSGGYFSGSYSSSFNPGSISNGALSITGTYYGPQSAISVSGSSGSITSSSAYLSSANVTTVAAGSTGTTGVAARQTVSFNRLNAGDTATVGGLTLTAAADLTSTQVAEIFASKIAGTDPSASLGSFNSTAFIGGFNATSATNVLTLTGSTDGPMSTVSASGFVTNRVALSSANVTIVEAGSTGTPGVYAQQTVTLSAMNAGDLLTIGDLAFTAASSLTGAQVAAIFASKITSGTDPASSLGSFVGSTFSADFNATSSGDVLTFTGASYGPMDTISVTGVLSGEDSASTAIALINEFMAHISATQASMMAANTNLTAAQDNSTKLATSSQKAVDDVQNIDLTALQANLQALSVQQSLDFQVISQMNSAASSLLSIFR
jgi:flagellin-like hook-associated protein FlgL